MCVDDDVLHLRSLERILRRRGYSVVGFDDPERALEAIPVAKPDLLFLDILMPGMSGLDFAEQVREQFADTLPVVLLTARGSDREIADGYRKGATHYITKPCDPRTVVGIADYLLGEDRAPGSGPEGPAEESAPELHRKHVVVCVDDEPQILSSLRRLLRNEPYEVLTTERADEALEWVERKDVSVLISDQRMPEIQGTQLLEEVFRRSPVTARIILTGYPGSTVRIQGLKQGIQLLVYKPWEDESLKRTIRRLLHDRESREGVRGAP
jgi:DNA-binding response OmpR family regulator